MESDSGFKAAIEEAKAGFDEGGVPIGACLVSKEGKILGRGHNMRVQKGSAILHVGVSLSCGSKKAWGLTTFHGLKAEMSALEATGRLPPSAYQGATMYTTLSVMISYSFLIVDMTFLWLVTRGATVCAFET